MYAVGISLGDAGFVSVMTWNISQSNATDDEQEVKEINPEIELQQEEQKALSFLYWNNAGYHSRSDMQANLGFTDAILRRVCNRFEESELVNCEEEETAGGVNNRHLYTISSVGIHYVKSNNLDTPTEVENKKQLEQVRNEKARLEQRVGRLRSEVDELKQLLSETQKQTEINTHYQKQMLRHHQRMGHEIEKYS